ncbi:MAG TPA: CocE/NonD family hydrolase, partial [bacterium]|nr:CocE/NonD family hydrolase [bacterium]
MLRKELVAVCTIAAVVVAAATAGAQEISVVRDVEIPMADGVTLSADIYSQSPDGRFPTVLVRTPYDKGAFGWLGEALAGNGGYAVVVQDVRGQVSSEGDFQPFVDELADGTATLDWVVAQPWCDGNVGMWGASYLAYCGLLLAGNGHPALKTVVNISGWGDPEVMGSPGGTMHLMVALPWSLSGQISGETEQPDYDEIFPLVPVSRITELAGIDSPIWPAYFE